MNKGDALLWAGLIGIFSLCAFCFVLALLRSFSKLGHVVREPGEPDRSEYDTFWRGRR